MDYGVDVSELSLELWTVIAGISGFDFDTVNSD